MCAIKEFNNKSREKVKKSLFIRIVYLVVVSKNVASVVTFWLFPGDVRYFLQLEVFTYIHQLLLHAGNTISSIQANSCLSFIFSGMREYICDITTPICTINVNRKEALGNTNR